MACFSVLFHSSLLLFVFFEILLMTFEIKKKKTVYIVFLVCLIASYVNLPMQLLRLILSATKYGVYFDQFDFYNSLGSSLGSRLSLFVRLCFLFFMFISIKPDDMSDRLFSNISWFILAISISDVFSASMFMLQRVKMIFYLSYMVIVKYLVVSRGSLQKVRNNLVLLYFIFYFLILKLLTGANAIIPYQYILF